jgi:ectoine hydroxylase-related dioxygenase (phytanoyl-CoA dioxygenase family)
MDVPHLPAGATGDDVAAAVAEAGCAVVDELVPAAVMAELVDELRPWLEATPAGPDDFSGRNTRRTGGLIGRSRTVRGLVTHPLVLATAAKVLAHATNFQLHLTQMIAIGPGEPAQLIHRDQWAFDFFPFPAGYEVQCNTLWAASPFTEKAGATRVIPGSHRFEDKLRLTAEDTVPAEMATGSVLFYTGALYHGGGANQSDEVRYGLNLTYNLAWLRQEENQYLAVPFEVARTLPEPLLRLMGYARGAYALGYVDDLRDPLDVLLQRQRAIGLGDPERPAAEAADVAEEAAATAGAS